MFLFYVFIGTNSFREAVICNSVKSRKHFIGNGTGKTMKTYI